jgi:signal transduction histidine kinase
MNGGDSVTSALDTLYTEIQRLVQAESESEICKVAVDAVPPVFNVEYAGLWLYDSEAAELQLTAQTDRAKKEFGSNVVYRPGNSLSWEAFTAGELRRVPEDVENGTQYNDDSLLASELILPIGDYGVLNIASVDADVFSPGEVQVARILAANVESALARAQREHALKVQNDRLETFVSMVSHDLQNPLTVADGHLELARQTGSDDHLENVSDALDRMETLINDLLTLAEEGEVVEERTRLDLCDTAKQAWSNVYTPEATLQTTGTVDIFGDKSRLLQVFENLYRNAVEHVGSDVTIYIGQLQSLHTTTRVSTTEFTDGFYIADDGPGIPLDDPSRVFESGHSTDSTGLGLAIVERIIEAHGWEITASRSAQGGARFEIHGDVKPVTPFST